MKTKRVNGAGVGLRPVHIPHILEHRPRIAWFEILIDNYLYGDAAAGLRALVELRADYPMAFHSVGLDVGSVDPVDPTMLRNLRERQRELEPDIISTHLCWTAGNGFAHHDLLPLPFTGEAVEHCAERIRQFQDFLGERILIENISTYLRFAPPAAPIISRTAPASANSNEAGPPFMNEGEFLRAVAEAADCWILLDVNNMYINYRNHGDSPAALDAFFADVPGERVRQYHLAGHEYRETHLLDTHGAAVSDAVWKLFERALRVWGPAPACVERDENIPTDFQELHDEANRAARYLETANQICD